MDFEGTFFDTDDYFLTTNKLGSGSFGEVFVVERKSDNAQYAAKIINNQSIFSSKGQKMFLRESLILHKINHPAIIKFHGINFHSFNHQTMLQPTILTEYLKEGSLKKILNDEKGCIVNHKWNATKKMVFLLGISHAMKYLHNHGIIHRDLKPQNILVDSRYNPRICDFGLSKCFSETFSKSLKLVMSGEFGTPLYMPPEMMDDENDIYNHSVDVYSFGMIAYEICTGR